MRRRARAERPSRCQPKLTSAVACAGSRPQSISATMVLTLNRMMPGRRGSPARSAGRRGRANTMVGSMALRGRLPGSTRLATGRPSLVDRHEGEVGELVVEQEAAHHGARAEGIFDAGGHGEGVAVDRRRWRYGSCRRLPRARRRRKRLASRWAACRRRHLPARGRDRSARGARRDRSDRAGQRPGRRRNRSRRDSARDRRKRAARPRR